MTGSLQARSSNLALLRTLVESLDGTHEVRFSRALHELPAFNSDLDIDTPPPAVAAWRAEIAAADAVAIATPEYAFGIAGALKNALDWVVSSGEFVGKPVVLVAASTLETGASLALEALERTIRVMTADVVGTVSVPFVRSKLDATGAVNDEATQHRLRELANGLATRVVA